MEPSQAVRASNIPALYEQYKETIKDSMHPQIDMLRFLEVHKRGIDYYNSYGLGNYKKESLRLKKRQSKSYDKQNVTLQTENPSEVNLSDSRKRRNSDEVYDLDKEPVISDKNIPETSDQKVFKGMFRTYLEKKSLVKPQQKLQEQKKE